MAIALNLAPACPGCFAGSLITLDLTQVLLLTVGLLFVTTALGLYNDDAAHDVGVFRKRFLFAWPAILAACGGVFALGRLATGAPLGWSFGILCLAVSLFMALLFAVHFAAVWWLDLPFMKKRVLVLGEGAAAEALGDFLKGPGCSHFEHVQTLRDEPEPVFTRIGNTALAAAATAAPTHQLAQMLQMDQIVVAIDDKQRLPTRELLECKLRGVEVIDALMFWEREAGVIDAFNAGPDWLTFSRGFAFSHRRRATKRAVDLMISLVALIIALPLCLVVALAIRLESPGPIFYRQERVGLNNRVFKVWKFRSMTATAEQDGVPRWAAAGDDRVTRVGGFIRKVRIDEIPQIINVLAGEMSFIGPRPERPFFVEQLKEALPHYNLRHYVRPGITGWAQVNYPYGASVEDAKRKLAYDLFYLKNNDVFLDIAILLQTIRVVLFAHGSR